VNVPLFFIPLAFVAFGPIAVIAFVGIVLFGKWAAARLLFRLNFLRSIVLALTPFIYLPGAFFMYGAAERISSRFPSAFHDPGENLREVLGFYVLYVAGSIAALAAMLLIDAAVVGRLRNHSAARIGPVEGYSKVGWLLLAVVNVAMSFFWMAALHAIQFSPALDFDG
jgi:hypothetical protein